MKYFDSTFTFDIYLGTSWKEATVATESIEILTGWWKDMPQIFGTGWISCGFVVSVNENIWEIFAPWRGRLTKKLFWNLLKSRVWFPLCKISPLSVMRVMFFAYNYHIFDKNWTEMFPLESLTCFSSVPIRFIWLWSKLSKIWAFTFCNFRNP